MGVILGWGDPFSRAAACHVPSTNATIMAARTPHCLAVVCSSDIRTATHALAVVKSG